MTNTKELETKREKSDKKLRDMKLGDMVWVPEQNTGLLVKVMIVHKFHVPGAYSKAVEKDEGNPDNIVWAKHELGNGHFRWFALYADSEAEIAEKGITDSDKFTTHHENSSLRTAPDETTQENFIKKLY